MRKPNSILCCLLLYLVAGATLSASQPSITADENYYDGETQQLVFLGEAVFEHENTLVEADEIHYDRTAEKITALGNVRVTQPGVRLVGHRLVYHVRERRFESDAFRIGIPPIIAEGSGFAGTPEDLDLRDTTFYLGEPHPRAPRVDAGETRIRNRETLSLREVRFSPGFFPGGVNAPAIPLPDFSGPMEDPGIRFSGGLGYRRNLGAYFQTDTLFPVTSGLRLGGSLDGYSKRGFLLGPSLHWFGDGPTHQWNTALSSGFIRDGGERGEDRLLAPIDRDRGYFALRHQQVSAEHFRLTAKIDWWSDSEVVRDFREDLFRTDQEPDNFVEASYLWSNTLLTFFTRYDPNEFHPTVERLPELRVDHLGSEIGVTGVRMEYSLAYSRLRASRYQFAPNPADGLVRYRENTDRWDGWQVLRRPLRLTPWADLTPMAGWRMTHWRGADGIPDSYTRWMGLVGFDLALRAHATWEREEPGWGINGIRHLLNPVVQYRWMPGGKGDPSRIIAMDRPVYSPYAPPLDFHQMRDIDLLDDRHLVRFGLENLFQTRSRREGTRTLLDANLYQDLYLSQSPSGRSWHATYAQVGFRPAGWLEIDWEHHLHTASMRRVADRVRISLIDGDVWRLTLFSEFLKSAFEQYGAEFQTRLNDTLGFRTTLRFDRDLSRWTEQRYAILQQLGQSWEIEYRVSAIRGSTREDDFRFSVGLRFLGF